MGKTLRKIITTLLVSVLMIVAGPTNIHAQTTFDLRYSQAQQYYAEGRYDEAILVLRTSLEGVGLTGHQRSKANSLLSKCREAATEANAPIPVSIIAKPGNVKVTIDGSNGIYTPFTADLQSGGHSVHFEKEGYFHVDTVFTVSKETKQLMVTLKPQYATLKFDIKPEEGYAFTSGPAVELGGRTIDLSVGNPDVFDGETVRLYQMYKDGIILVPQGYYVLILRADGFDTKTIGLSLRDGDERLIAELLPAQKGAVEFIGNANSVGATVLLDGEQIGILPMDTREVSIGNHTVSFRKTGMKTSEDEYVLDVQKDATVRLWADMKPVGTCMIRASQEGARLLVDGKDVGTSPLLTELTEGKHRIMAVKDGYYHGEETFDIQRDVLQDLELSMSPARSISFSTDDGLTGQRLSLYTKDGHVLSEYTILPCDIPVPAGINRFTATVYSDNRLIRSYLGPLRIKDTDNAHVIRTFPMNYIQWLNAGLTLSDAPGCSVSILKFSPLPFAGLSTSLLKADFGIGESLNLNSLSCLLLNWELRVGGAISESIDAGFVGTFTYHPDCSSFIDTPLMTGKNGLQVLSLHPGSLISTWKQWPEWSSLRKPGLW